MKYYNIEILQFVSIANIIICMHTMLEKGSQVLFFKITKLILIDIRAVMLTIH